MALPQNFIEKAETELMETENLREQSLKEFREWLDRHDYFVDCRKDDTFLLQFLRTKKFRMEKVTELFENHMLLKHSVPRWYDFNDEAIARLWNLYESGAAYPLKERDKDGRRIILVQTRKMDPKEFTASDAIHLLTWIAKTILEEEETQIAGIITIIDQTDITFGHLRLLSMNDLIDFASVVKSSTVGRQKGIYLVNLPSFASFMFEVAKKAANDKLRERIHLIEDMEKMKIHVDSSLLPLELGGTVPEADMMRSFKKIADEREGALRSIQDGVDWDRVALDGENSNCSVM